MIEIVSFDCAGSSNWMGSYPTWSLHVGIIFYMNPLTIAAFMQMGSKIH